MKISFKILFLLVILCLSPLSVYADGSDNLFRGFGVNALTVDGDDDLAVLQNHATQNNVNSFRIQYFNTDVDANFENDADKGAQKYLDWVENTVLPHFAWLKAGLDSYGVRLIFCLHNPVGGRDVSGAEPFDRLFNDDELMDTQILAWTMVADVYNGTNVDYQIFSEPAVDTNTKWQEFYTDLIEDISEASNQSTGQRQRVVIMPRFGNPSLVKGVQFEGLPDIFEYVLGVNMYSPFEYTHQGTTAIAEEDRDKEYSYPSDVTVRSCDKQQGRVDSLTEKLKNAKRKKKRKIRKRLRKAKRALKKCERLQKKDAKKAGEYHKVGLEGVLAKAIKKADKDNVLLWIMEWAIVTYADGAARYLKDLGEVYDENGISSFYHILFEAGVWDPLKDCNRQTQSCEEIQSSDRMDALKEYFSSNQFPS